MASNVLKLLRRKKLTIQSFTILKSGEIQINSIIFVSEHYKFSWRIGAEILNSLLTALVQRTVLLMWTVILFCYHERDLLHTKTFKTCFIISRWWLLSFELKTFTKIMTEMFVDFGSMFLERKHFRFLICFLCCSKFRLSQMNYQECVRQLPSSILFSVGF